VGSFGLLHFGAEFGIAKPRKFFNRKSVAWKADFILGGKFPNLLRKFFCRFRKEQPDKISDFALEMREPISVLSYYLM
jgi:hypothetical protein